MATNAAALTEVVSGKINFAEPANPGDIAQKVVDFYNGRFEAISERRFGWSENVEKTVGIYEKLMS